jgi:hypothetical protein
MLESDIQRRFITAAHSHGMQAWPVAFRGRRGMPDVLVMNLHRYHCLVELKQEGARPNALQNWYHGTLRHCIDVHVACGLKSALALAASLGERRP